MIVFCIFFFFNDTATTEIYTLSLHDALPIFIQGYPVLLSPPAMPLTVRRIGRNAVACSRSRRWRRRSSTDRKSTRLNSSHANISYAVFCLKKKKTSSKYYIIPHLISYPSTLY